MKLMNWNGKTMVESKGMNLYHVPHFQEQAADRPDQVGCQILKIGSGKSVITTLC